MTSCWTPAVQVNAPVLPPTLVPPFWPLAPALPAGPTMPPLPGPPGPGWPPMAWAPPAPLVPEVPPQLTAAIARMNNDEIEQVVRNMGSSAPFGAATHSEVRKKLFDAVPPPALARRGQ